MNTNKRIAKIHFTINKITSQFYYSQKTKKIQSKAIVLDNNRDRAFAKNTIDYSELDFLSIDRFRSVPSIQKNKLETETLAIFLQILKQTHNKRSNSYSLDLHWQFLKNPCDCTVTIECISIAAGNERLKQHLNLLYAIEAIG